MSTKTVEELSVELGKVIAFGEVIDLLIAETRAVSEDSSSRLDRINEYNEKQAVLEVLRLLRQDVVEMSNKVGK
jgi:hypothetical protein